MFGMTYPPWRCTSLDISDLTGTLFSDRLIIDCTEYLFFSANLGIMKSSGYLDSNMRYIISLGRMNS